MKEVAEETGGALLAGNDLKDAIARGLSHGSTYYTLGYAPTRDDADAGFRRIEVRTTRGGVLLAYRPGYYPTANQPAPKVHPLVVALQPGMPAATMLPLTVRVLPVSLGQKTQINYTIDASRVSFNDTPDHRKRAVVGCLVVAFTEDGTPVRQTSNTMQASLTETEYQDVLRDGLQLQQEIDLPLGKYDLRIGVMDHSTQQIGTLQTPLVIDATNATK